MSTGSVQTLKSLVCYALLVKKFKPWCDVVTFCKGKLNKITRFFSNSNWQTSTEENLDQKTKTISNTK